MKDALRLLNKSQDVETSEFKAKDNTHQLLWLQGEGPGDREVFMPSTHVEHGHLAIVRFNSEQSTCGRGWEVVLVTTTYQKQNGKHFDCTVLAPSSEKARGTEGHWLNKWYTYALLPALCPHDQTRVLLEHGLPIDAVAYAVEPAHVQRVQKGYKFPRGCYSIIAEQVRMIELHKDDTPPPTTIKISHDIEGKDSGSDECDDAYDHVESDVASDLDS